MFYKIIVKNYPFEKVYRIKDINNIPSGKIFEARIPFREGAYISDTPVIHFCDNAFDTMLWHNILIADWESEPVFYEINPLTRIIKQKCDDNIGLFQCGASCIQFIKRISVDNMYEKALAEYNKNPQDKITMYPNIPISTQFITALKNHTYINSSK